MPVAAHLGLQRWMCAKAKVNGGRPCQHVIMYTTRTQEGAVAADGATAAGNPAQLARQSTVTVPSAQQVPGTLPGNTPPVGHRVYEVAAPLQPADADVDALFCTYVQSFASDLAAHAGSQLETAAMADRTARRTGVTERMLTVSNSALRGTQARGRGRSKSYMALQIVSALTLPAVGVLGSYLKDGEIIRLIFTVCLLVAGWSTFLVLMGDRQR